jgi:hypothetical protein
MNAKDHVPVAVGASDLQTDRISRSGEPSLSPAAASSSHRRVVQPPPLLPHLSHTILHLFPFQIRGRVYRYGAKNLYRKMWYISHRKNTNVSSTVERCHLQHNFNISNHSSSHKRSHISNLFSPCPKVSRTTPKTYRSWSRKRIALRALGTLNVTLSLPRNCANQRRFNCLWYEERPPLQTIKVTCKISSAKSSTAL